MVWDQSRAMPRPGRRWRHTDVRYEELLALKKKADADLKIHCRDIKSDLSAKGLADIKDLIALATPATDRPRPWAASDSGRVGSDLGSNVWGNAPCRPQDQLLEIRVAPVSLFGARRLRRKTHYGFPVVASAGRQCVCDEAQGCFLFPIQTIKRTSDRRKGSAGPSAKRSCSSADNSMIRGASARYVRGIARRRREFVAVFTQALGGRSRRCRWSRLSALRAC
jgi:hypothetical protein